MTTDLPAAVGRRVRLPGRFADPVDLLHLEDLGDVIALQVRTAQGILKDETVTRAELEEALAATEPRAAAFVDPHKLFLLVESTRIRLAYAWDPYFAVSLSGIEPLPHQLEAVYERMLPQPRLRFLLADDPGAGKTIMAGLLLKELKLRGAIDRVLILAPAPLTLQWQDELRSKFDEVFERIESHGVRDSLAGSPWARHPQCVASVDFAKQDHIRPGLLRERWDLVIIDEAHKAAMPDDDHPTLRFRLCRELAERTDRLLLLTATPHQGNPDQFRNLMSLLDEDIFRNAGAVSALLQEDKSPWFLRRMKEDLRGFDGRRLFVERHIFTESFKLNAAEWALYEAVTAYTNRFLGAQQGRRKQSAALARTVMQRRLSSSLRAIRLTLENRHQRLRDLLDELNALPEDKRTKRLKELAGLKVDPERDEDDETEEEDDEVVSAAVASERYDLLVDEVAELDHLVDVARRTEDKGDESKLKALFRCLERADFKDLREHGGKLLLFTEHRATLDYLRRHLEDLDYRCCAIHGGMPAVERKRAEQIFRDHAQICIATEAAGEGINLQFCHLMINYDMPWNPNRLEQRMGRIHRFGQEIDCHVFNFVATSGPDGEDTQPVVEGRILFLLLEKLKQIRKDIGDRVFDVIGLLLTLNNLRLEDALREATYNPKVLDDYADQIRRIDPSRLKEYEQATGIALAKRTVDLARVRAWDHDSEEKRLMPEFVEDFFEAAATHTRLRIEHRANPHLLRIEHVPQKFRARSLASVQRYGEPESSYLKATFRKAELKKLENRDGELLSPGHPLYRAVDEVLEHDLRGALGGTALYLDPLAEQTYRLHFFKIEAEGESLGDPGQPPRTVPISARLVALEEGEGGELREVSPDVLHDLTPVPPDTETDDSPTLTPEHRRRLETWARARIQHRHVQTLREERARELEIRRAFLEQAFDASVKAQQVKVMKLKARVVGGETDARIALDDAERRLREHHAGKEHRLRGLTHLAIVRSGPVAWLGSALVLPRPVDDGLTRDPEVEHFAYAFVIRHEEGEGRRVEEIWKRNDSSGYDLRATGPGGEVRRIEVKGRAADTGEVMLTPNEWRKAQRLRDTYWLYVVWGCKTGHPRLKMIHDPWGRLQAQAREVMEVKGYWLAGPALEAAPGDEWRG